MKKKLAWAIFAILSVAAAVAIFAFKDTLFSIDIKASMDRGAALAKAKAVAAEYGIGPKDCRDAASFSTDDRAKCFIELEGGGVAALKEAMAEGSLSPNYWEVRRFNPGRKLEARLFFSADGAFIGFEEKLPEDEERPNVGEEKALELAQGGIKERIGLDLGRYSLAEKSLDRKPNGREDRSFVFERSDKSLGEGKIRLSAVVSGDRLTELRSYLRVPEAFDRRFESARSMNQFISTLAVVCWILIFVGAIFGAYRLMKDKSLAWKKALALGFVLSILTSLGTFNALPLLWMGYDTAVDAGGFIAQQIVTSLLTCVLTGFLYAFSIMVAEGLTRKAFPEHPQFWKLMSREAGASRQVLARAAGAYLAVPFWLLYVFIFYTVTMKYLGWWSPAEAMMDPNVVALYIPWLSPFSNALQAGIWEELFFRALPIAGAALIGERIGKRKPFVIGAVILQALIFGASHASYMGLPGYSRLVEIFVPAILLGIVYVRFGVLPGIIAHFSYDAVLMSLPLFGSSASSLLPDRVIIVLLVAAPLLAILFRVAQNRGLAELAPELRNSGSLHDQAQGEAAGSAVDKLGETETPIDAVSAASSPQGPKATRYAILSAAALAALGLGLLFFASDFSNQAKSLNVSRAEAVRAAKYALRDRGLSVPKSWKESSIVDAAPSTDDRYAWAKARSDYASLKGSYLEPAHWEVRFADFESGVNERESYTVDVAGSGQTTRLRHELPQKKAGKSLSKAEAEGIALAELSRSYGLAAGDAKEMSAEDTKQPERVDWSLDYSIAKDAKGVVDTRVHVELAGDEVVDSYRYVFVPEDWRRNLQNEQSKLGTAVSVAALALALLFGYAAVRAVIAIARKRFAGKSALQAGIALAAVGLCSLALRLPSLPSTFSLAQPYGIQITTALIIGVLSALLLGIFFGLLAGYGQGREGASVASRIGGVDRMTLAKGIGAGLAMAGVNGALQLLSRSILPPYADFSGLDAALPFAANALGDIRRILVELVCVMAAIAVGEELKLGAKRRKLVVAAVIFVAFAAQAASVTSSGIGGFFASAGIWGATMAVLYLLVFAEDEAAIAIACAAYAMADEARLVAQAPYAGAALAAVIGAAVAAAAGLCIAAFLRPRARS
jgi:hypothetical protein